MAQEKETKMEEKDYSKFDTFKKEVIADYKIACVGNSSSGIKETPAFKCPTVNIGSRQQGRLRAENVLDADYNKDDITKSTLACFHDADFLLKCQNAVNPYGVGDAGKKIASILSSIVGG